MKTLILLLIPFYLFALEGYSNYKIYSATDTFTHVNHDSNLVRGSDWSDRFSDSIENSFVRFSDIDDSSFTQMSIDTVDADTITARTITADSATIPIFKGNETHRGDSNYFAGIGRFAGKLYAPVLDADSIVDNVTIGLNGKKILLSGNISNDVIDIIFSKSDSARFAIEYRGSSAPGVANKNRIVSYYDPISIMTRGGGTVSDRIFIDTGNGYVGIGKTPTTALDVNGVITTTTLNTGNGDNELYPMNQAVRTTDDPTFDSATVTDLKVTDDATIDDDLNVTGTITGNLTGNVTGNCSGSSGSCTGNAATATTATNQSGGTVDATTGAFSTGITIAGGSQLTAYLDTTFYDSLYDNTTYRSRGLCRIVQVGKVITLYQPLIEGNLSGGSVFVKGIPSKFLGSTSMYIAAPLVEASSFILGFLYNNGAGTISLTTTGGTLSTGNGGLNQTVLTWILN